MWGYSVKKPADILKYFEDAFWPVTLQAWCFQDLQQIGCEKCGLRELVLGAQR
jgi:hypothetical protein